MAKPSGRTQRGTAKQRGKAGKAGTKPGKASKAVAKPERGKPGAKQQRGKPGAKPERDQTAAKQDRGKTGAKQDRGKPGAKPERDQTAKLERGKGAKPERGKPGTKQPGAASKAVAIASKRSVAASAPRTVSTRASSTADHDKAARAGRIAELATTREALAGEPGPVQLGSITVPSGTVAIFDVGLMGYLPRAALDPLLICAPVPADRALSVVGTRVGKGRFADCWDHVAIALAEPGREVARARKLGKAAVDFARLIVMDRAAIDHWRHEDSLDQLADFVFWGRDDAQLARALGARRLATGDGYGWTDLPLAEAEVKADRAAELKAEHRWLLATELRPHSHHFDALAAARMSPSGAGVIEVGGARVLLFFTSWGDGVYPVYLDVDHEDRPIQIRIQLAPAESAAAPAAIE